ncbi:hypothetical protein [Candidatus Palauibacter sp.]|uniref:hypothetical protein n=1 Tax=Candidatus Palauibacter sp. TaxID=3101350 RepID=UPI003CC56EA1
MIDTSALLSLGKSLKTAADLLKSLLDLGSRAAASPQVADEMVEAFNAKIRELSAELLDARQFASEAQASQFALADRVRELEEELVKLEDWAQEKERYTLDAVDSAAFAYVLKPDIKTTEPPHWLCAHCFEQHRKSVLQFAGQPPNVPGGGRGDYRRWACSACGHALMVFYTKNPSA